MKRPLKTIAKKADIAPATDADDRRAKLTGHSLYCENNIEPKAGHPVKGILISRDPRDKLKQPVLRSVYYGYPKDHPTWHDPYPREVPSTDQTAQGVSRT